MCTGFLCAVLRDDPSTVNISDEMTKTSFGNVWKSLNTDNGKKDQNAKRYEFRVHSVLSHFPVIVDSSKYLNDKTCNLAKTH